MYQMVPQSSVLLKLLILAHVTFILVDIPVNVRMRFQIAFLGKLLATNRARVNLYRFPNQRIVWVLLTLMNDEFNFLVEYLITGNALHLPLH